jgi:predicted HD superfamily hydrolase involved in NAD metabolism
VDKYVPAACQMHMGMHKERRVSKMSLSKDLMELEEKLEKVLSPKRFFHTRGVMYTSAALAMRYGADMEKALYAGLLHDCAKCLSNEEQLEQCKKNHLPVRDIEKENPYLLHAKVGAYFAETKYGITDPEILSAIRWHTTGKPEMSLLEKIVFTADYMEPGRKMIEGMEEIRACAFVDLDKTVYRILYNTLNYLKKDKDGKKKEIDCMTQKAYNYYERSVYNRD